jgi:tRNA-modifying protein YgfZ
MTGYAALRESAGWLELPGRGKIRMTGEDRVRLLHAMTTNSIQQLTPGTGCYAFFLSAQGRILSDVNVFCFPDSLLLDTEPETRQIVFDHLDKYIIADDVTLEDVTSQLTTIALQGPQSGAFLVKMGAPQPQADFAHVEWVAHPACTIAQMSEKCFYFFIPPAQRDVLVQELENAGAAAADGDAFHVVRLEEGKPRYGEDISERYLAQEANIPQALNFQKGCYLGQEIVERVRSRGQVHRVLMPVAIESTEAPPPGTKLPWGEITSSAYSPSLNKVVALAYVRTELAKPGTDLEAEGLKAIVR